MQQLIQRIGRLSRRLPQTIAILSQALDAIEGLMGSPDSMNKIALYEFTADILMQDLGVPSREARQWLLDELNEDDDAVRSSLGAPVRVDDETRRRLKGSLLGLEVVFRMTDAPGSGQWQREMTAYVVSGGPPTRHRQTDSIDRSDLPLSTREAQISSGCREHRVKILPAP